MKTFESLQAAWREATTKLEEHKSALRLKYGPRSPSAWWSAKERRADERLYRAEGRTAEAFYAWLDVHSPWEWRRGVQFAWVRDNLTLAMATSETPPMLPPESASWGVLPIERTAERKAAS